MSNNWQRCHVVKKNVGRDGNFHNECMVYICIDIEEKCFFFLNMDISCMVVYICIMSYYTYWYLHLEICLYIYIYHIFVQAQSH